jgi:uracil-DNA glycosylase
MAPPRTCHARQVSDTTTDLRKAILTDYAKSVGLSPDARYFGGARLRPVVPLDAAVRGIFILGAYPSARFEAVSGENDVPVGDNLGPFEPERYFDGTRVRTQRSADELAEFYLRPLGIERAECWVTDIVKVFLFKEGHREKYRRLGVVAPNGYERERFEELANRSMPWIQRELELSRPRLVITLGSEIAGIVRGVASQTQRNALLGPTITTVRFGTVPAPTVHLAHPGIVMRKGSDDRNPWPRLHQDEHIPALRAALVSPIPSALTPGSDTQP